MGLVGAALLAAGLLVLWLLLGGDRATVYESQRFSFEHPPDWRLVKGVKFPLAAKSADFGRHVVGRDGDVWVSVSFAGGQSQPIVAGNVDQLLPYTCRLTMRFAAAINHGEVLA